MQQLYLSIHRFALEPGGSVLLPLGRVAAFALRGRLKVADAWLENGEGGYFAGGQVIKNSEADNVAALVFSFCDAVEPTSLASLRLENKFPCLLRLDEVVFEPGQASPRHSPAGPAICYVSRGGLQVKTQNQGFEAIQGNIWFEQSGEQIEMVADSSDPKTTLLRCMVLPVGYPEKPSIARDGEPVTRRHVNHLLDS